MISQRNASVLESLTRRILEATWGTTPHMLAHTILGLMFSRFLSGKAGDVITLFYISMTHDRQTTELRQILYTTIKYSLTRS